MCIQSPYWLKQCLPFSYTPSHTPVAFGLPDTAHLPTVGDSP